jgi:DNA ligase-1
MIKKPILAGGVTLSELNTLTYPVAISPKLDGIRCIKQGKALSRSFKDIPNQHIQETISSIKYDGLDGEIMSGKTFQDVSSGVMRETGDTDFQYWIFDYVKDDPNKPYMKRMEDLGKLALPKFCKKVLPVIANDAEELQKIHEGFLAQGFEGTMIRSLNGPYKFGRSSLKQGFLLKLKPFKDSECELVGFEEQMHNDNEAEEDNFGRTKRSTMQENMVPMNTLGAFIVKEIGDTPWNGKEFRIGTGIGLTKILRQEIWDNKKEYLGKIIKYRYQEEGTKDLPRIPSFQGFRDKRDM